MQIKTQMYLFVGKNYIFKFLLALKKKTIDKF